MARLATAVEEVADFSPAEFAAVQQVAIRWARRRGLFVEDTEDAAQDALARTSPPC